MTDFMDTALNYQPGVRIAADAKRWVITNGITQRPLCKVCRQPIYEGHVDCTCDKNHPENCFRPTYSELEAKLANSRRISGDNMDFAVTYRKVLQALLDRHNADGDSLAPTVLSPTDVAEIETALQHR